jgi:hypothetical protein
VLVSGAVSQLPGFGFGTWLTGHVIFKKTWAGVSSFVKAILQNTDSFMNNIQEGDAWKSRHPLACRRWFLKTGLVFAQAFCCTPARVILWM